MQQNLFSHPDVDILCFKKLFKGQNQQFFMTFDIFLFIGFFFLFFFLH